ncbi:NYN domain-containing protein [Herpetosiphon llansteffanensis]
MPYLIDGHNLIGQLATIRLNDPDDEAKLVQLLQRFAITRKVSVSVVFDRGQYTQRTLGGGGVTVRFARSPSDADEMIKSQLVRLSRASEWVLVSSDRAITSVADAVGARVINARDFAALLESMGAADPNAPTHQEMHAHVRQDQLPEWLDFFGFDKESAESKVDLTRKPKPNHPSQQRTGTQAKRRSPQAAKPIVVPQPPERWQLPPRRKDQPDPIPRDADGRPRLSRGSKNPQASTGERLHKPPPPVHPDEIDEWLEFFGADEE